MAEEKPRSAAEKERTTALAKVPMGHKGVMIQAMDDLKEFAETAVKAGVAPKGMDVGGAMMAIQAGLERGMLPLGGLQAAVVINGVLSWRGWAAMALMRQSGLVVTGTLRSWVDGETDGREANAIGYASAKRIGYDETFVRTFSVSDAKKAGLWTKSGPWQTRPGNMLEWRALGDLVRFHFPEVMGGIPIAEDVEAGGVGPAAVTVEGPAERAARPAPEVSDPLLAETVEGDATGIVIETRASAEVENVQTAIESSVDEALGDRRSDEPRSLRWRSQHPDAAGAVVEKRKSSESGGVATPGRPAGVAPPGQKQTGQRQSACPRCGDKDSGFAKYGECGVCNYPENEPGT